MDKLNLFDLFAKITLDTSEYEQGVEGAKEKGNSLAGVLKSGLATAGKAAAAGLAAASTAAVALGKASLDSYAEYEQLVGGVDTLFKESSQKLQDYAANAYQTAGMSANDYMSTVTSFSASLIQSLGGDTEKAVNYADMAIVSMSDNANKMGTSMESIQNAYQGFAKQNFTMLDNLKLGYGGTKEEMVRLLRDVEKLEGFAEGALDASNFSDVVYAIDILQDHMGIAGATAAEAATTIEGSTNSMKAAWANLVTGIADENADLPGLVNKFVDSVGVAADNIIPRISQILTGLSDAITQIAPVISAEVPALVSEILPPMVDAGAQLLIGLTTGLISALPDLIASVPAIIDAFVGAVSTNLPAILEAGKQLLSMFANGIADGKNFVIEKLPEVISRFYEWWTEQYPQILQKGSDILEKIAFGIIEAVPKLIAKLPEVIKGIVTFFTSNLPKIAEIGGELLGNLIMGILGMIPEIAVQLPAVITAIVDALQAGWEALKEAGKYLLEGLWAGISDKVEWLKGKVTGVVDVIKGWFTGPEGFDTHSPSRYFKSIGEYMMQGLAIGMENSKGEVMETASDIVDEVKARFNGLVDALTLQQDIGNLEYELWEKTYGQAATEAEKYDQKLKVLNAQETAQAGVVETAYNAYLAMSEQYGENSAESLNYQKILLQEGIQYQELLADIEAVIAAKEQLASGISVGTVDMASSTIGITSAAMINSATQNQETGSADRPLNIKLVTSDNRVMADWLMPALRYVDKSNPEVVSDAL